MSSEVEIIRCWLTELFKTIEIVDDVKVKDFKFGPLEDKCKYIENTQNYSKYKSLAVLRQVSVAINVRNAVKDYSLVVKVLPTDDNERYSIKYKFKQLLKFSKEVQVYLEIVKPMFSICNDKLPQRKFFTPPVARVFLGQMDALNDCLVLENVSVTGFVKYKQEIDENVHIVGETSEAQRDNEKELPELISHSNIVLQNVAKFHALSICMSKVEGKCLSEEFPFAVEGEGFRQMFQKRIFPLKDRLLDYLKWDKSYLKEESQINYIETKIDNEIQDLFWRLLEIKAIPKISEKEVLIHGDLEFHNLMFRYEDHKPVDCKFLDLSHVSVSSPVIDIIIFLYSVLTSSIIDTKYLSFLLHYHSHLSEFCQQFGVTEDILSLEELVEEFQEKKMYGMMMTCKVIMAEYMLKTVTLADANTDDPGSIYLSPAKASLFLQNVEDLCLCPTHRDKLRKGFKLPEISKMEKMIPSKTNVLAFVTFIKASSLSPTVRHIL